ncbi:TIGR02301 family protein [Phenylobacterium sp. 20VBR1]|uniref:TIGR02301 family protein n=1 Tax=Phenylobacterium glaciei TaxID=2803784 RepID=A0A941D2L9_9CAUL|nr:TIGR02301 family protein [Phenylobacterium glaciei]MBR7621155.1 TIGR02301 family protein [Phenylobacterium glaciei]
MRRLMLTLALAAMAFPVLAQDRSPALRQNLVDLAYVLGESHALRQACAGLDDQYWRTRMMNLVSTEKPDTALDARLKESFNTGFASRQSEFQACSPASRRAELAAANHGLDISNRLAKVMIKTDREAPPTIFEMNATGEQSPR